MSVQPAASGSIADALTFYRGKRVFVTGHTGFKGSWLVQMLLLAGAEVTGYALAPSATPNLYDLLHPERDINSVIGDVRDFSALSNAFAAAKPEIVLHLAAQPIVRESYVHPRETYETNVMGTVNLLECVRAFDSVRSFLNVTTDKVYENTESGKRFSESDPLDGYDPYSNSKSCSELVTHSYCKSFFADGRSAISTARAGNVIGGGDFAVDRIIPDCVRAAISGKPIFVRNPNSVRPYQHVLDPLGAYLLLAARQGQDGTLAGCYNIGPDECDCVTTGELATLFCRAWGGGARWESHTLPGPHEANYLRLDCDKLKSAFHWSARFHIGEAVENTVAWAKLFSTGGDVVACTRAQIQEFLQSDSTGDLK